MNTPSKLINLNITFRNTQSTDAIKDYATQKLIPCIQKFVHQNTDANLVLNVEKNRHIAEISFHTDGKDFHCKNESTDLYASLDALGDTLQKQLRKHKERLTSKH